jgi:hypothetical protein
MPIDVNRGTAGDRRQHEDGKKTFQAAKLIVAGPDFQTGRRERCLVFDVTQV